MDEHVALLIDDSGSMRRECHNHTYWDDVQKTVRILISSVDRCSVFFMNNPILNAVDASSFEVSELVRHVAPLGSTPLTLTLRRAVSRLRPHFQKLKIVIICDGRPDYTHKLHKLCMHLSHARLGTKLMFVLLDNDIVFYQNLQNLHNVTIFKAACKGAKTDMYVICSQVLEKPIPTPVASSPELQEEEEEVDPQCCSLM